MNYKPYKAPFLLRNGHLNTLYAYWFCKVPAPSFTRSKMNTQDGDFIDLDWLQTGSNKLLLLLHGLEGSTNSSYIRRMSTLAHQSGYDVCAMNHRSCGGQLNLKPTLYHSGFTQDLHQLVQMLQERYAHIAIAGYSLGGNVLLKYLGDGVYTIPKAVKAAVAISTPVHLSSCAVALSRPTNYLYEMGFLKGLKKKMIIKAEQHPAVLDKAVIYPIRRLVEFDHKVTAPLHGFRDAEDYYERCSSLPFLKQIKTHSLLVNALDDPMLGEASYPFDNKNPKLHFLAPKHGGHVGFAGFHSRFYWIDRIVLDFIQQY